MKKLLIFGIMMLLLVSFAFAAPPSGIFDFESGLAIETSSIGEHHLNESLNLYGYVYDSATGVQVTSECNVDLHYGASREKIGEVITNVTTIHFTTTFDASLFNRTGIYQSDIYCLSEDGLKGGVNVIEFEIFDDDISIGVFGLWKPVEDWTFPGIYLILTIILIGVALAYGSSILGVLGSVMLIMAYFIIGATSPVLFAPLLIVGFLLAFKFANL